MISVCLYDITPCMRDCHLQLNLLRIDLLVLPTSPSIYHNIAVQLGTLLTLGRLELTHK